MVVGCGEIKSALAYDDGKGGCTSDLFDVNDVVCMCVCLELAAEERNFEEEEKYVHES